MVDFEKAHIRRIIQLDPVINQLFHEFIWRVAPRLKRIRLTQRGFWKANPVLEKQIDIALREFAAKYKEILLAHIVASYELSERRTDDTLHKFLKGLGITIAAGFLLKTFNRENPTGAPVDLSTILTLPRRMAARDAFFKNRLEQTISPRVWSLVSQNKTLILNCASSGILEGKSAQSISRELRKYLKDPNRLFRRVKDPETGKFGPSAAMKAYHPGQGVYRSSYKNALRLARTEVNQAYRKADMDRWQKTDFILGYDVKLSGSHPEFDLCDEMAGRYPKDFTFIGWHVQCYCFAVPVLPTPKVMIDHLQNDSRIRGHVNGMPGRAEKYVKSKAFKIMDMPSKKRPYWIQDNYKIDGKKLKLNIQTSKSHSYEK